MAVTVRRSGSAERLIVALKELNGIQAKTGWFETARYPDGTPVAYVAAIQEFGAGPIPARSTMRPTVALKGSKWMELLSDGAKAILTGGAVSAVQVMEQVALVAAGDVADAISKLTAPPLSLLTLQARAHSGPNKRIAGAAVLGKLNRDLDAGPPNLAGVSTKPLVWTGLLIQSVTGIAERRSGALGVVK